MEFSIALAFNPTEQWVPLAAEADRCGFGSIVVSDHLVYPGDLGSRYPYTADGTPPWQPDTAWPDPMVAIGAMASATERIRFVTSIYLLTLRHPVVAAKQVATADVFSGGRVILGVGAGWMREEFDLLGVPYAHRGRRLEEAVEVMRRLWSGEVVEHRGEFFDFDAVQVRPTPPGRVPIWGGGSSDRALRRAATLFDGWASELRSIAGIREVAAKLRRWRAESGRADEPFGMCVACSDAYTPAGYAALEELGVTQAVTVPWLLYGYGGDELQPKLDALRRFRDEFIQG